MEPRIRKGRPGRGTGLVGAGQEMHAGDDELFQSLGFL